ncbi:hypothetical protein HYH02_000091 [Chlamydomonas schloesseri]|uniref:DNA 3'-5' helicase n=1 Tax=Chlamydomonas schloesseri TaxID=2026947 RepID=A0A835WMB4_9CHLO|nr:hypothetical protein HYH02_000091 [Chlamydomonas schloesseri]|eukprot:KAG2449987.1 hypothetical protein HYH02_000091 [Chlamydomonas schloesseri]
MASSAAAGAAAAAATSGTDPAQQPGAAGSGPSPLRAGATGAVGGRPPHPPPAGSAVAAGAAASPLRPGTGAAAGTGTGTGTSAGAAAASAPGRAAAAGGGGGGGMGFGAGRLKRPRPADLQSSPGGGPDADVTDALADHDVGGDGGGAAPAQRRGGGDGAAGAAGAGAAGGGAAVKLEAGLEDEEDEEDALVGPRRGRARKAARIADEDEEEADAEAGGGGAAAGAGAGGAAEAAAAAKDEDEDEDEEVVVFGGGRSRSRSAGLGAGEEEEDDDAGGVQEGGGAGPGPGSSVTVAAAAAAAAPPGSMKARAFAAAAAAAARKAAAAEAEAAAAAAKAAAKPAKGGKGDKGGKKDRGSKKYGAERDSDHELPDDAYDEVISDDDVVVEPESDDDDYVDDDDDWSDEDRPRGAGGRGRGRGGGRGGRGGGGGGSRSSVRAMRERALGGDPDGAAPYDTDFSSLVLKTDHSNRPLWVTPDNRIFLETFSPIYKQAYDFLIAISEPVCRPEAMHEYQLTPHSLYAAVSVGLETETIINVLNRLSKVQLSEETKSFIRDSTANYGKVKLVLKHNRFYVESAYPEVLKRLLKDKVISEAAVGGGIIQKSRALREYAAANITTAVDMVEGGAEGGAAGAAGGKAAAEEAGGGKGGAKGGKQAKKAGGDEEEQEDEDEDEGTGAYGTAFKDIAAEETEKEVQEFEVKEDKVEEVKKRCMPEGLNYPMLEEYDFRNDRRNPDLLPFELKPHVKLRPYQEKSLSKMFGNGRARSGIIVLPCGAGKSLVGVAAASRVKKSCLCLCTSSVSVDQWKYQFQLWTSIGDHQIARFTSENKEMFPGEAGVLVTTFTMIAFSGKRSEESERIMNIIRSREWGLLLMDEVHVVPAQMFRTVISTCKSHCKLGLTATLVREDERIADLNFLIGPKLYEANWLDLTRAGHIANVQCAEVWCPMTAEFYREYLKKENSGRKQLLYVMNPNKFMACQFLIDFHERVRGDKCIVFSDNIWALREYATRMRKPFIYGPTSHAERTRVLHAFKHNPDINTVFLSKVGDNSLDIPEANVLIQISSHAGSRRQEAQRLGRILRAKRGKAGSGHEGEFNAFFYTLVSNDTQEMYYSTKRQQFLIDQGYSFKVVTNLLDAVGGGEGLMYSDRPSQLDLLSRVLSAGMEEAGVENLRDEDAEGLAAAGGGRPAARRRLGDMLALTGGAGYRYMEYGTGGGRGGGGGGRGRGGYQGTKAQSWARKLGVAAKR